MQAPLTDLDEDAVENVYIFVADSVRYDELPDRVAQRGLSFKTAAHALATPQCLPTIVSGRLPPKHGVTWFHHIMSDDLSTVFDMDGFDTGYFELLWLGSAVQEVLGNPDEETVESVKEPFVLVEHDNGGHAPYPESGAEKAAEMLDDLESKAELQRQYRQTIQGSVDRFEERLELLEDRGLRENTLVIYIADHGELLDERGGFVGHAFPMMPEIVYVPSVFIHPSLPEGKQGDQFLHHVDLYPTIISTLTDQTPQVDGDDLTEPIEKNRPAYSQSIMHPPSEFRDTYLDPGYDARGVWTRNGGHVFVKNPRPVRLLTSGFVATKSEYTASYNSHRNILRTLGMTTRHFLQNGHRYLDPEVDKTDARKLVADVGSETQESETQELSEETKRHLSDLGYR
jgi:arylsulfatase A-like enzyme